MRVGWVSVSPTAKTGYGRETGEICGGIIDRHEIVCIGHAADIIMWGGKQEVHLRNGKKLWTLVMGNPLQNRKAALDTVKTYVIRYKLELLIGHWDAFALEFLRDMEIPYLVYVPVDGPMTQKWYSFIRDAYRIITYSKFGYKQMLRFAPPARVNFIPHGCHTSIFRPLNEEKAELRKEIEAEPPIPEDCILYLFVGANIGDRKKIPLLIKTFRKFAPKHPKAHLHLHLNPYAAFPKGYDLPLWVNMHGIRDKVHFPRFNPILESVDDNTMCRIYNAADCLVHNSVAEGFGLPLLEGPACGLPLIVGRNSACIEMAQGHGWIAENVDEESYVDIPVYVPNLTEYPVIDQRSLLEKMDEAYHNEDLRKEYGRRAREFALKYDWKNIMPKWFRLLDVVEEELQLLKSLA